MRVLAILKPDYEEKEERRFIIPWRIFEILSNTCSFYCQRVEVMHGNLRGKCEYFLLNVFQIIRSDYSAILDKFKVFPKNKYLLGGNSF